MSGQTGYSGGLRGAGPADRRSDSGTDAASAPAVNKRQTAAVEAISQGNQRRGLADAGGGSGAGQRRSAQFAALVGGVARPRFVLRCGVAVQIPGLPTSAEMAIARNQGRN